MGIIVVTFCAGFLLLSELFDLGVNGFHYKGNDSICANVVEESSQGAEKHAAQIRSHACRFFLDLLQTLVENLRCKPRNLTLVKNKLLLSFNTRKYRT